MKTGRAISGVVLVTVLAGQSLGCAALRSASAPRQPYRSAMLNADFTSAYPRSADADPLGVTERRDTPRTYASRGDSQLAVARPSETPQAPMAPGPGDSAYQVEMAAAYVTAVYSANQTATSEGAESAPDIIDIYRFAQREGQIYHASRPAVGDLVFFHNTWDRNGDGRNNDWYTHVGLVESVDGAGTVAVLSYLDGRVSRTYLNLEHPEQATDENGRVINTTMRRRSPDDPPYTQYLASELLAGFGSLLGERTEVLVIDNWQPGMDLAAVEL